MIRKSQRSRLLACWLVGLALAVQVQASHSGPPFYIDDDNPPQEDFDGDYHFHSIQAALEQFPHPQQGDTLYIAPGTYEGDLLLQVEGLTLQATGSAEQTIIVGQIVVAAKRITLTGLTVDGTGRASGVSVLDDKAMLEGLSVFGAEVGVDLGGRVPVRDVVLERNRLYHNGIGLRGRDISYSHFRNNVVEANAGNGGVLQAFDHLTFEHNAWASNGEAGLALEGGRDVRAEGDQALHNAGHGMALSDVQRAVLVQVSSSENGGVGARLYDAADNVISGAAFGRNAVAGLKLEGRSQDNVVEDSHFQGQSAAAAAGLWLAGEAYDNQILENQFQANRVGVRLSGARGEAPAGNRFEGNGIENSSGDGIRVEASTGDNLFEQNRLLGNNANGAYIAGRNDRWQQNLIRQSGGSGLVLDDARNVVVEANEVLDNGEHGVKLQAGAQNNVIVSNTVRGNDQSGVALQDSPSNHVQDNAIEENQRHGVALMNSADVRISGNRIRGNGELGLWLDGAFGTKVQHNIIQGNNRGGVALEEARDVDLEANAIYANLHVGLRAQSSQAMARRNWWGDAMGPAGFFEGRGNAVTGLALEYVLPWLSDEPQRLELASVSASVLDGIGPGEDLEFDWQDRAGLKWQLSGVGEDGERFSLGVVLVSRYREGALPGALALYGLQVSGFEGGHSQLTVSYGELPADVDVSALALWRWEGERWIALPGVVRPTLHQVSGEVDTAGLAPGLIALATGEGLAALDTLGAAESVEPRQAVMDAASTSEQGLGWVVLAWGLLGAMRLVRRFWASTPEGEQLSLQ